jgi:nucleoid-associated protein YgaU
MPVKPDSRFANLPVLRVLAPDGSFRQVIALRIGQPPVTDNVQQYRVVQGDGVDLLARRFYGDEGLWWRILDANPVVYPLDIQPNDILNVPAPGPSTRITRARGF